MFKDKKQGKTNYCNHKTDNTSGICDKCLGKTMQEKCKCEQLPFHDKFKEDCECHKVQEKSVGEQFEKKFDEWWMWSGEEKNMYDDTKDFILHLQKETDDKWKQKLMELLAKMETAPDARECRHLLKEIILDN